MEKLYSHIIGTPIFEEDIRRPIAAVRDVVMDTETGKVIAFVVNTYKNLVVAPVDVVSFGTAIKIHPDAIISGEEVLRVSAVQKKGIRIYKNRVFTKSGIELGRVIDFSIDAKMLVLKNLYVAKGVLGFLHYGSKIIPAKCIIEVLHEKIVVQDSTVKEALKEEILNEVSVGDLAGV
ncbi:MAG: PRC-barrel domain-containing protein [Candidatus Gracilibacteria bacterium]